MESIILATAIALTVLLISIVSSPRLKALIYSFPIPITVILLGTGGNINITHIAGLVFAVLFMVSSFLLYKKLKVPILIAIILSTILYVAISSLNRLIVDFPFLFGYGFFLLIWAFFITNPIRLTKSHYAKISSSLARRDYLIRGIIVFTLAYTVIGLKGLILGAAVTFPFSGIFTIYVMRNQLPVFITEIMRNIIGVANFFLTVWLLEDSAGLLAAVALGWIACGLSILIVAKYIPNKYREITA